MAYTGNGRARHDTAPPADERRALARTGGTGRGALAPALAALPDLLSEPANLRPGEATSPARKGELKSEIVQAVALMQDVEWGGTGGSIEGTVVRLPLRRLWMNPLHALEYDSPQDKAELDALAESLKARQEQPLIVAYAVNPKGGVPGRFGDHLIVDGKRRFLAAPNANVNELLVCVRRYATFFEMMLGMVTAKASTRPLTPMELAAFIFQLEQAYALESERNPRLPRYPTQEELARRLGISQSRFSRLKGIADLHHEAWDALATGEITMAHASELVDAPPDVQRVVTGEVVGLAHAAAASGAPAPTRDLVRERVRVHTRGPSQWIATDPVAPPDASQLFFPHLLEHPAPAAVGSLLNDLERWFESAQVGYSKPNPDIGAMLRLLKHQSFQTLIEAARNMTPGG